MDEKHSNSPLLLTPSEQPDQRTPGGEEGTSLLRAMKEELVNELQCDPTRKDDCLKSKRTWSLADADSKETTRKRIKVKSGGSEQGVMEVRKRQIGSPTQVSSGKYLSRENLSMKYWDSQTKESAAAAAGSVDNGFHEEAKKFRKTKSSTGDDDQSTEETDGTSNGECLRESEKETMIRPFSPEEVSSGYETSSSGTEEIDIRLQRPSHTLRYLGKKTLDNIFEEKSVKRESNKQFEFRTCLHGSLSDKLDASSYEKTIENKTLRLLVDVSLELQRLKEASDDPESIYSLKSFTYPGEIGVQYVGQPTVGQDKLLEATSDKELEFATRHCLRCSFNSDELASDYETFREIGNALVVKLAAVKLEKLTSDNDGAETIFVRKEFVYPDSEDEEETDSKTEEQSELFSSRRELHSSFECERVTSAYEDDRRSKNNLLLHQATSILEKLISDVSDGSPYVYEKPKFEYTDSENEDHLASSDVCEGIEMDDQVSSQLPVGLDELQNSIKRVDPSTQDQGEQFYLRKALHSSFESSDLAAKYERNRNTENISLLKQTTLDLVKIAADLNEQSGYLNVGKVSVYSDSDEVKDDKQQRSKLEQSCAQQGESEQQRSCAQQSESKQEQSCAQQSVSEQQRSCAQQSESKHEQSCAQQSESEQQQACAQRSQSEQQHSCAQQSDSEQQQPCAQQSEPEQEQSCAQKIESEQQLSCAQQTHAVHRPLLSSLPLHGLLEYDDLRKEYEEYKNTPTKAFQVLVAVAPMSADAGEEPRSLCNRKEFTCPKLERENEPMELQGAKGLEVFLPEGFLQPHLSSIDCEELGEEYEEYHELKRKCIKILSDLDLKSSDAGKLAVSACDRKEFDYLHLRKEQGRLPRQKTEEFEVFRPQPAYDRHHGSLECEKLSQEYVEYKQLKNKCIKVLAALDPKSTAADKETGSLCNRKEFNCPQSMEEKGPQQLQNTEEPNILKQFSSLHCRGDSFENKKLSSEYEDNRSSENCGENGSAALKLEERAANPIEEPTPAYIRKEEDCPGDKEVDEPSTDEELEACRPHAYHRRHCASLVHEEIQKEHEEYKELKKKCINILSDMDPKCTDVRKLAMSGCHRTELDDVHTRMEPGPQHQQKTEEPETFQHFYHLQGSSKPLELASKYEAYRTTQNSKADRSASLEFERISSDYNLGPPPASIRKRNEFLEAGENCEEPDQNQQSSSLPYLHGSLEIELLAKENEDLGLLENEVIHRIASLDPEKLKSDSIEEKEPVGQEVHPPQPAADVPKCWSRCCLHTSFESGDLFFAYEGYRLLENQDIHRRASLEILRSNSMTSEESVSVLARRDFAYPDTDDEDEPLPSSLESFLLPFRNCLNASFASECLSQQYEACRTIENDRLMNQVCLLLKKTAVAEPSYECDSLGDKENASRTASDDKYGRIINDCPRTFIAAESSKDCSRVDAEHHEEYRKHKISAALEGATSVFDKPVSNVKKQASLSNFDRPQSCCDPVSAWECSPIRRSGQQEIFDAMAHDPCLPATSCVLFDVMAHDPCLPATSCVLDFEAMQRSASPEEWRASEQKVPPAGEEDPANLEPTNSVLKGNEDSLFRITQQNLV